MSNKIQVLEEIDRKINQEFLNAKIELPFFISSLPLINKVFLLTSTFKKTNSDTENKEKLHELLNFCQGDKTQYFINNILECIKEIHNILDEIF